MIKSKFLLFLLLFCSPVAMAQEQDKLLQLLKSELTYSMNELKKQAQAPYYMNLRAMDDYTVNVTSSFGAIASSREARMRTLVPQVRLGSLELDNFKYNSQGAAQDPRRGNVSGVFLPLDDETTEGIREAIWRETLKRYKFAQQQLEVSKTKATVSVEDEDKAPCFSGVTAEKYYEAPLDGFPVSNGHGRTSGGGDPVSRQSNLVIETAHPYTESELRQMLIEEAKKQGKEYGYYFNAVTSGFTYTGEGGSLNSFNVTPLEVYRVYVDGRPDELVRGVDMIGTPLSMFSNITAAGDQPAVFTGMCGAESGWVPVTACSPMIYVSQVETQRRAQSRDLPPVLPAPEVNTSTGGDGDEAIFGAMDEELRRNMVGLSLPGEAKPYYLSYVLTRYRQWQIAGSLGGIFYSTVTPWQSSGGVQVMLGNYQHNSDIQYMGQVAPVQLPAELDGYNIRRGFWETSDLMYRFSLQVMARKIAHLKSNPLPPAEAAVPDMQQLPAVTKMVERPRPFEVDLAVLEGMVKELSVLFKDYKELFNSNVMLVAVEQDNYRLTSENVRLKFPLGLVGLTVSASVRTTDGSTVSDVLAISSLDNPADLPSIEELKKKVKDFADNLMELKETPMIEEYYTGPVLFEGGAASRLFTDNLLSPGRLLALRTMAPARGMLDEQLGRRIIDSRLTVKNYTTLAEYNGTPLFGCYEIDGDGVVPAAELTLVENGVFKRMLNGRVPTLKAPESTGSARFMISPDNPMAIVSPGTIHVQASKGVGPEKLKKALLKAAKEADLEYAYIVRRIGGEASAVYKVNVKDGKEIRVRVNNLSAPELTKLMDLKGISSDERVMNYFPNGVPASLIYPSAIIVGDVEINRTTPKIEEEPVLKHPLQR